jgi:hypothetical protein
MSENTAKAAKLKKGAKVVPKKFGDLLFEIGAEEIPAGMIEKAAAEVKALLEAKLVEHGLIAKDAASRAVVAYGAPRRLTAIVRHGGAVERGADAEGRLPCGDAVGTRSSGGENPRGNSASSNTRDLMAEVDVLDGRARAAIYPPGAVDRRAARWSSGAFQFCGCRVGQPQRWASIPWEETHSDFGRR